MTYIKNPSFTYLGMKDFYYLLFYLRFLVLTVGSVATIIF